MHSGTSKVLFANTDKLVMDRILVSGGTGFLGKEVVRLLKENYQVDIISRTKGDIQADLSQWKGGIDQKKISELKGQYIAFVHLAGLYDFHASKVSLYNNNVCATHGALTLSKALNIPRFVNASTIATVVNQKNLVDPYTLKMSQKYPDYYATTKAFAEEMLRFFPYNISNIINLRLGILVGSTDTGRIEKLDGHYKVIEFIKKIKMYLNLLPFVSFIPAPAKRRIPLVPVNIAAKALVDILQYAINNKMKGYNSFYITPSKGVSHKYLYQDIFNKLKIKKKVVTINFIPISVIRFITKWFKSFPSIEMEYGFRLPFFDTKNTEEILGADWCPEYSQYKDILWQGYEEFLSNS